jgi:ABC-type Fe3+ transport system permease subunit
MSDAFNRMTVPTGEADSSVLTRLLPDSWAAADGPVRTLGVLFTIAAIGLALQGGQQQRATGDVWAAVHVLFAVFAFVMVRRYLSRAADHSADMSDATRSQASRKAAACAIIVFGWTVCVIPSLATGMHAVVYNTPFGLSSAVSDPRVTLGNVLLLTALVRPRRDRPIPSPERDWWPC